MSLDTFLTPHLIHSTHHNTPKNQSNQISISGFNHVASEYVKKKVLNQILVVSNIFSNHLNINLDAHLINLLLGLDVVKDAILAHIFIHFFVLANNLNADVIVFHAAKEAANVNTSAGLLIITHHISFTMSAYKYAALDIYMGSFSSTLL
jgi:hypothetical protein